MRVRVLIDDSMTESDPEYLALFGAHPNVDVRIYKPFGPKHESLVLRGIDYAADLRVLNRRMHNKLFVVDGRVAIVGGRNIGNESFEYPGPFVFRGRDLLALGPVVTTTHAELDRTGVALGRVMADVTRETLIESAYLILLEGEFAAIDALNDRGAVVKLVTDSMASNNHLTAFVGYSKQRKKLLATGAELYEMRPDARSERALFTAAQLKEYETSFGLHAKTAVFDRRITFVGSFNMDPRSTDLNTEMGLLVESETLANAVADSIEDDIAAGDSWRVISTDDGELAWVTVENGVIATETEKEPMTTEERRAEARVLAVVPDDAEL